MLGLISSESGVINTSEQKLSSQRTENHARVIFYQYTHWVDYFEFWHMC